MASQRIRETYIENGVVVTVLETVKPRGRRKSKIKPCFFYCHTDYAEKSNDKMAKLSLSHRANGRGN